MVVLMEPGRKCCGALGACAYRDPAGRRVVPYLSDKPFPEAPGAERLAGKVRSVVAQRGDVIVLCAREPHALLVVGQDDDGTCP